MDLQITPQLRRHCECLTPPQVSNTNLMIHKCFCSWQKPFTRIPILLKSDISLTVNFICYTLQYKTSTSCHCSTPRPSGCWGLSPQEPPHPLEETGQHWSIIKAHDKHSVCARHCLNLPEYEQNKNTSLLRTIITATVWKGPLVAQSDFTLY